jgi:acetylornithine deacetylase
MMHLPDFHKAAQDHYQATKEFLLDLLRIDSVSGNEDEVMWFLHDTFGKISDRSLLMPLMEGIKGKFNLIVTCAGITTEKIIINAHADTVPVTPGMPDPAVKDNIVYGRGACDDKGQIAACFLLLQTLKSLGLKPFFTIELHIVAEEETGGNGTLALMDTSLSAKSVVVMEPTSLKVLTGARGAVWFRIKTRGFSGHSGNPASTRSAILTGIRVVELIREYHSRLLAEQIGTYPFEGFENPMPLTFGKFHSGQWPATVPEEAIIEGVLGFLPGKSFTNIMLDLDMEIRNAGPEVSDFTEITYPFRRNPYVMPRKDAATVRFGQAVGEAGLAVEYSAFPACCDAWFYRAFKGLPVIIFGAGELKYAHASDEQIDFQSIFHAAHILFRFSTIKF